MACAGAVKRPPQSLLVRSVDGEDHLNLMFVLKGRNHKLLRPKDELLEKTLKRITLSATKPEKVKKGDRWKQAHSKDLVPIEAHLLYGDTSNQQHVEKDTPNDLAWVEGRILVVGDVKYSIRVNVPAVAMLKMSKFVLSGCPTVPEVEMDFTNPYSCKWTWKRYPIHSDPSSPLSNDDPSHLETIGTGFAYWPSSEDVGHRLLVEVTPTSPDGKRIGTPSSVISPVVTEGPTDNPVTRRHLLTPACLAAPEQFRVVTYNVLAGAFTSSVYAHETLYPYCDPSALDIDYRECLIVHELLGYNADVICLQEVDNKTFDNFFLPSMKDKGYDGYHCPKTGMILEGEAIFFNTAKFSLMSVENTSLNEFIEKDPSCSKLYNGLQAAPYLLHEVLKKRNIALVVFLRCLEMPDNYLCIANTHLYYHPMGDCIRLVQVVTALNFIRTKIDQFLQTVGPHAKVATILCGDFNSCPCIAAYKYVLSGSVSQSHPDWMVYKLTEVPRCECDSKPPKTNDCSSSSSDEEGDKPQSCDDTIGPLPPVQPSETVKIPKRRLSTVDNFKGLDLEHEFHFQNACGTKHYTNYTLGFKGVLDYVFLDCDQLTVERVVPLPSHREVTEFVALPSVYFPSDHLALVVDLKWK